MLYTINEYQKEFHPTKHLRSVQRMIKIGLIPVTHNVIKLSGIVLIDTCQQRKYEPYLKAIRAYNRIKGRKVDVELSVKLGIENNVESIKLLNEILGL